MQKDTNRNPGQSAQSGQGAQSRSTGNPGTHTGRDRQADSAAVTKSLGGIQFPKRKQELVRYAKEHGQQKENQDIVAMLDRLPDREYKSMSDVERGVGEVKQ